jgi:hypothetical protein
MVEHIEAALVACSGRIEGKQGAAAKLASTRTRRGADAEVRDRLVAVQG